MVAGVDGRTREARGDHPHRMQRECVDGWIHDWAQYFP